MTRLALSSVLFLLLVVPAVSRAAVEEARTFTFTYRAMVGPIEAGAGPVHVFVPLPVRNEHQRVLSEVVEANVPGKEGRETVHGNRFWHGELPEATGAPIEVTVTTTVERRVVRGAASPGEANATRVPDEELRRYLDADSRVVVGHPVLDPILAEIRAEAGQGATPAKARAIYDWVVDNVEYKKVGSGWGNGDTFWACSERYGNCTDFHALFNSLARTEGIPARFEIGFPVPTDRPEGEIGGYHCWVQLHLPETAWFPIDASEAFKHPEQRELLYGTQPPDRIHFSTGRDLELGPGHRSGPLNYFVYPHVEVGGEVWKGPIEQSFRYREDGGLASAARP